MSLNVPYQKIELMVAAITASSKLIELGEDSELKTRLEKLAVADLGLSNNEAIAKHNGITVTELINSPNMAYMASQYKLFCLQEAIATFKEFGFTDKEAWACLLNETLEDM